LCEHLLLAHQPATNIFPKIKNKQDKCITTQSKARNSRNTTQQAAYSKTFHNFYLISENVPTTDTGTQAPGCVAAIF